jgi:mannose-1-phosphate guanylyltransferase
MRAILLAAGLGMRLRPITSIIPKCLVPIHGKPLIDYWIEQLIGAGIERLLINTHYLHEQVESHIKSSEFANKIDLFHEDNLLLTGGTVLANKDYLKDDAFMLIHADNLSICDFSKFINVHNNRPNGTDITMMTFLTDRPSQCGIVELDSNNIVQNFYEKQKSPPSNLANAAVYIVESSVVHYMDSLNKKRIDFSLDVLPHYMGQIMSYHNSNYHRDIGSIESYSLSQVEYYFKIYNDQ